MVTQAEYLRNAVAAKTTIDEQAIALRAALVDALYPIVKEDFRWQWLSRGCSPSAALREAEEKVELMYGKNLRQLISDRIARDSEIMDLLLNR